MSEGFLSRWSRVKAGQKVEAPLPAPDPAPAESEVPPADKEIPELPPIETLTKDSDFSAFLRAGVPEDLRKAALSKLWASDPLFTQPEVYDLHMGDYTQPAVAEAIKTAWRFGKGMVERLADEGSSAEITQATEKTHDNAVKGDPPIANAD